MKNMSLIFILLIIPMVLGGCVTSQPQNTTIDNRDTLTLGTVQRNVKKGASQSEVVTALGSPNIITNDGGKETWVYDKISTVTSADEIGGGAAGAGVGGTSVGVIGVSGRKSNIVTSQKTLTVIIKFDNTSHVEEVTYHTSKY